MLILLLPLLLPYAMPFYAVTLLLMLAVAAAMPFRPARWLILIFADYADADAAVLRFRCCHDTPLR